MSLSSLAFASRQLSIAIATGPTELTNAKIVAREHERAGSLIQTFHLVLPLKAHALGADLVRWLAHSGTVLSINRRRLHNDRLISSGKMVGRRKTLPFTMYRFFRDMWAYESIRPVFPRATNYRAGFILLRCQPKAPETCQVLLVHQRQPIVVKNQNGIRKIIPPKMGFPKGTAEPTDLSAWDTAMRELREELGDECADVAKIYDCECVQLLPVVMVREVGQSIEVHVYFVVVFAYAPIFDIDINELGSCGWYNWSDDFNSMARLSEPARAVLNHMRSVCPDTAEDAAVRVDRLRQKWRARLATTLAAPNPDVAPIVN